MTKSVIASLGLFVASVSALGSAVVVNQCSYEVYLSDVPATGGGYQTSEHTLSAGQSWSQQWTPLTNSNGWSIKLGKEQAASNIMQYEYTYQSNNPGTIWYDLSDVNGNPWNGDWEVNAEGADCDPKDHAYRFATDDAYGEQNCPSAATITVTLCSSSGSSTGSNSNNSGSGSGSGSGSVNAPAPESPAAPESSTVPETSAAPEPVATTVAAPSFSAPSPSTPATTVQVTTVQVTAAAAPSTTEAQAQAPAPSSTAAPAAAPPLFGELGLDSNGAVIIEKRDLEGRDAAAKAPSLTTFATFVSAAAEATAAPDTLNRRHEHMAQKHRHHHNA